MLSSISQSPLFMAQLPLAQAGQLLLVVGVSFIAITLISSTFYFHKMIELTDDALTTTGDRNDFFFVQVARYLSKINRTSSGFGILIVQFCTDETDKLAVQKNLLELLKQSIRVETDKACLFSEDCVAAIIDSEEENIPALTERIMADLKKNTATLSGVRAIRAGASTFPMYGLNTQTLIDAATAALETSEFDGRNSFCIAPPPEGAEQSKPDDEVLGELGKQDKNAALDPLTGVLSPTVIGSYMRKYMAEIRHKKQPAALLCVGINRMDEIAPLYGETAVDDVIVSVSKIIQRLTRDSDLIGRYHRDDFVIIASCSLKQGELIATRLREAVQKEVFISGGKRIKASVSIGISAHPEHGRNIKDLFGGAYRALEVIREWETTACLVYDAARHEKKAGHAPRR